MYVYNKGYKSIIITLRDGKIYTFNRDAYISLDIDPNTNTVTVTTIRDVRTFTDVRELEY